MQTVVVLIVVHYLYAIGCNNTTVLVNLLHACNCTENACVCVKRLLIAKEYGDKSAERRAYSNLGNAHIFLGNFAAAAEFYQ